MRSDCGSGKSKAAVRGRKRYRMSDREPDETVTESNEPPKRKKFRQRKIGADSKAGD